MEYAITSASDGILKPAYCGLLKTEGTGWEIIDPPDELNKAPEKGLHFGFPYCHGYDILDSDYGKGHSRNEFEKSEIALGPHVAALGMLFLPVKCFPPNTKARFSSQNMEAGTERSRLVTE